MSPPSRDAKILYDWRARPVVVIEEAVGYSGSTLDNGKFISATSTVFDNLDRPIFVATWGSNNIPDVEDHVEYWAEMFTGDYAAADIASAILSHGIGPVTLSHTIYDERGRPFEQRSYDVTDNTASTYQFTKTYRDDLNRVLGELSPSGFTENTYDSLGRVTETSHWSQQDANDQTQGAGVELTRSQTQYDIFGNVEVQISYDRLDINGGPGPITYTATRNAAGGLDPIPSPSTSNAIITYTYNWYDNAKRLKATAYWGNAGTDLFTNGAPPVYSTINEPRWIAGATPEDEDYYKIDTVDVTGKAIVTRYGYDVQGRRIWSQDAKGIVSRTWYDLLGRTILQAENWNDNELFAFGGLATLTPNHSGQTRYTAHHFTRGGLNDLMVAIRQNFEGANITPGMIAWASGDINNDFAATTASLPGVGGSVQATHFVYGTPNIVSEIVNAEAAPHGGADPISTFRPLVSEIWYPDESGVPNANDAVKFTYTTSGQIASRTDQRGVTLEYEYGTIGSGAGLTAVRAVEPASPPIGFADYYDGYVNRLVFTRQHGRLTTANSKAVLAGGTASRSDLTFQYDGWGNLLSEYQKSSGPQSGTASYLWEENPATQNGSRLAEIQYPSGRRIRYDYGINDPAQTGETEDFINRVTGITGLTAAGAVDYHYTNNEYTGGGRKLSQEFGNPASPLIVQSFKPDAGVFKPAGLDRFGRITDLSFENATTATTYPGNLIHNYQYGYDPNGNREFARVTQASFTITTPNGGLKTSLAANPRAQKVGGGTTTTESHDNVESYLYGYDELNRLLYAEKGALDGANTDLDYNKPREGQAWELDTLGNWSKGGTGRWLYTPETGIDAKPGRDPFDTDIERQNHIIQKHNQINIAERYKPVDPNNPVAPNDPSLELEIEQFHYDPAGNLKQDAVRKYRYDAWGRLAEVRLVSTGSRVVTYRYDALGRRIAKDIPTSFSAALDTHLTGDLFFYAGDRVIELRHAYDDALPHKRIEQPGLPLTLGSQFASSAKKDSSPHQIDDPKLATQQAVGGDYTYDTRKEFVWGLDYIDEQVGVISHVNSTDYLEYTLQDPADQGPYVWYEAQE